MSKFKTYLLVLFLLSNLTYGQTAPAPDSTHQGEKPNPTERDQGESKPNSELPKYLCGGEKYQEHFDCKKVVDEANKFVATINSIQQDLKSEDHEKNYLKMCQAIQELIQSKSGINKLVKESTCSAKDGVEEDIWARDADAVLNEIIKLNNPKLSEIAKLEQKNTMVLLKAGENEKEEEKVMRETVLDNRLSQYGEKLHLSDDFTKKFIRSFYTALNSDDAKGAGKILAISIDSMSKQQKEKLKHFANSFATSKADQDFKQMIQLAMNNWSLKDAPEKPEQSVDECFTSTHKKLSEVKEGFLEAMKKDVAENRDDFWDTVDQAHKEGDEGEARKKLISKWGKTLPAYMQSLKDTVKLAKTDEEKNKALTSLSLIAGAIGETGVLTQGGKQVANTHIYLEDIDKGKKKFEVTSEFDPKTKAVTEVKFEEDKNIRNRELYVAPEVAEEPVAPPVKPAESPTKPVEVANTKEPAVEPDPKVVQDKTETEEEKEVQGPSLPSEFDAINPDLEKEINKAIVATAAEDALKENKNLDEVKSGLYTLCASLLTDGKLTAAEIDLIINERATALSTPPKEEFDPAKAADNFGKNNPDLQKAWDEELKANPKK